MSFVLVYFWSAFILLAALEIIVLPRTNTVDNNTKQKNKTKNNLIWMHNDFVKESAIDFNQSSGAVVKSRWPSWALRPNEPYGFCGRKATLNQI